MSERRLHTHRLPLPTLNLVCWREMRHRFLWPLPHKTAQSASSYTTYSVSFGASSSKEEAGIAQWLSDGLVVERCRVRVPAVLFQVQWVNKHPSKFLIQTAHTHTHTHTTHTHTHTHGRARKLFTGYNCVNTLTKQFTRFSPRNRWTATDIPT